MLKKDLEAKVKELEELLKIEQARPTGHTVSNCSIEMDSDKSAIAIAKAVEEGMKALQSIGSKSTYGIYFDGVD